MCNTGNNKNIYSDDEFPRFLFGVFWNDVEKKNRSEVVKVHDFF